MMRKRKKTNESHKEEDDMGEEDNSPQIDRKQMMNEPSKVTNDIA
jgi:hypothetical protein